MPSRGAFEAWLNFNPHRVMLADDATLAPVIFTIYPR